MVGWVRRRFARDGCPGRWVSPPVPGGKRFGGLLRAPRAGNAASQGSERDHQGSGEQGAGENRTHDGGFADLCLTTWLRRRMLWANNLAPMSSEPQGRYPLNSGPLASSCLRSFNLATS